jgi:hypothetical protein
LYMLSVHTSLQSDIPVLMISWHLAYEVPPSRGDRSFCIVSPSSASYTLTVVRLSNHIYVPIFSLTLHANVVISPHVFQKRMIFTLKPSAFAFSPPPLEPCPAPPSPPPLRFRSSQPSIPRPSSPAASPPGTQRSRRSPSEGSSTSLRALKSSKRSGGGLERTG